MIRRQLLLIPIVTLVYVVVGFFSYINAYTGEEFEAVPWFSEGFATTSLSVLTSLEPEKDDLNQDRIVTLTSTHPFDGSLTASHLGMIEVFLIGEGEKTYTVTGLEPDTTYHRYDNHYGNHTAFTTDSNGAYSFTVEVDGMMYIYIQNIPSTIFIVNDATGGDCSLVGEWVADTKTCILTDDVTESIQIGNDVKGSSDDVTLEGNGHIISGSGSGTGVYVYNAENVTVQNIKTELFSVGVGVRMSTSTTLTNIETNVYGDALALKHTGNTLVKESVLKASTYGVLMFNDRNAVVEDSQIQTSRATVVSIHGESKDFTLRNVALMSKSGGGIRVDRSSNGNFVNVDVVVRRTSYVFSLQAETDAHLRHTFSHFIGNGLPVIYQYKAENKVFDGGESEIFNFYCAACSNVTIKNYMFPTYSSGGIRIYQGTGIVIEHNVFEAPTMPVRLFGGGDIVVRENTFHSSAALTVLSRSGNVPENDKVLFYHNSSKTYSPPVGVYSTEDNILLSQPLPIGGNHWHDYDEPDEGCMDIDANMICDSPYSPPGPRDFIFTDEYPWISAGAWDGVEDPVSLALPVEGRYEQQRGVVAPGPHPERGYPDDEVFTFKVVYTNNEGTAPYGIELRIAGKVLQMSTDEGATDPLLRDGDFSNGEQYVATSTVPKGMHVYEFHATVGGEMYELITKPDSAELLTCTAGYSSVAFVPGIQSSRLFQEGAVFENQLWEPNIDGDARKLALNEDGTPLHDDIYTKAGADGVIDEALGVLTNIYKSFLDDLDDWKNDEHLIADYAVLPYDWRFAYETVLGSGVLDDDEKLWYGPHHATDTPYMYEELRKLAETSDSGRIFLVGHSMGGLMIKKMLADMEDDESHPYRSLLGKVDNVALVATPQLGTPKAVASLLHGIEQEMDIPIVHYPNFITDGTARLLGNGMSSAYTLLPSEMYFDWVKDVNLEGEEGSYTEMIINGDCPTANDHESMLVCFATIDSDTLEDDLITPLKPRYEYVEYADMLHDRIDDWIPPDMDGDGDVDFTVTQIAGWGIGTISAIEYKEKERPAECPPDLTGTCTETYMDPQPRYTFDGDRTVVVPSAVGMRMKNENQNWLNTVYVDMYKHNEDEFLFASKHVDRTHANILEITSLRKVLKNITKNKSTTADTLEYIRTDYSELEYPNAYMRLALHSPVDIEVIEEGSRIGKKMLPDGGVFFEANIPNSYYDELGEGKYVGFPISDIERTIYLTGTATGTFTFELKLIENGKITETKTFTDVPVTTSTKVELVFTAMEDIETLSVDTDGDGSVDMEVYPDGSGNHQVTYGDLIDALQELTVPYKHALVRRTQLAQRFDEREKERIAKLLLHSVERSVIRLSLRRLPKRWRIPEEDRKNILEIISTLKEKYEWNNKH